jgi:NDP-sugar pyrophosphorylase family protein
MTSSHPTWSGRGTIVITMAGAGQRFRDAGYAVPKYAIEVRGHTLFWWSLHSLARFTAVGARVVFVARRQDGVSPFLSSQCADLDIRDYRLVELDAPTDGQATTALYALSDVIDPAAPIVIYNIDTYVEPAVLDPAGMGGDGWIPCFPGPGTHWSFVRVDEHDAAREVREKQRISAHATIGLYHFGSAALYRESYARYYALHAQDAGERYVAPIYNQLIADGHRVCIARIPAWAVHVLGTPAEVERFASG